MEKNALVTGSSRGIGAGIARALSKEGWGVCVNYYEHRELAEALVQELRQQGGRAVCFGADVAEREQVDEMFAFARRELGEISLLVNNAGISQRELFQDISAESWQRIMAVNAGGVFNCTQAALPPMLHEHRGCIINMASIWGVAGGSLESAYTASKHAVVGLTKALAAELSYSGIRVNAVAPGVIETDMLRCLGEEKAQELMEDMPLGRFGQVEDVAETVLYLLRATYVTGQVITVDGGFLM